jgi:hypothetical protein
VDFFIPFFKHLDLVYDLLISCSIGDDANAGTAAGTAAGTGAGTGGIQDLVEYEGE